MLKMRRRNSTHDHQVRNEKDVDCRTVYAKVTRLLGRLVNLSRDRRGGVNSQRGRTLRTFTYILTTFSVSQEREIVSGSVLVCSRFVSEYS